MRNTGQYEPAPAHPVDIMREVFREAEFNFDDEEGRLFLRLQLDRVDVQILCLGNPDDVATIIVNLPIRATPEFRPQTGEFLHRLNFGSKRKFWEFDYNDGEMRLASYTDTLTGPLTKEFFRAILNSLASATDAAFPYLTGVLTGRMSPEFAADQAEAGIRAAWRGREANG